MPQYLNIQDVKENAEQYIILDATIIEIAHSSVKNEETYVEYEYNQQKYGVKYLHADFKKENGYLRSTQICKQKDIYRQDYCGCEFSIYKKEKED